MKYHTVCSMRLFKNTDDKSKADYGNSKWKPFKDGSPAAGFF